MTGDSSVILEKKDRLDAYLEKIFEEVYIPKAQNIKTEVNKLFLFFMTPCQYLLHP